MLLNLVREDHVYGSSEQAWLGHVIHCSLSIKRHLSGDILALVLVRCFMLESF
jgi:hypothetical protein